MGHHSHHHEAENSHGWKVIKDTVVNPKDWRKKCHKDKDFCKKFLYWVNESINNNAVFGKGKLPRLTHKEKQECKKGCHHLKGKDKNKEFNKCQIECWQLKRFEGQEAKRAKAKEAKRAAIEAKDTQSTAAWAAVALLFLLLIAAIATYVFWFRGKKDGQAKGTSKGSKSKASRKSRIGSHKSSRKSAKRSLRSKAGGSKVGGSKVGGSKSRQSKVKA